MSDAVVRETLTSSGPFASRLGALRALSTSVTGPAAMLDAAAMTLTR
jgi:hypothetical protein